MQKLNAYCAEKYVIAVKMMNDVRKVFQIVCSKNDGGLYIIFPYYRHGGGQMGEVYLDSQTLYPTSMTVGENFSISTHYVKYSHHPSGNAHFSLTGKVKTTVRKASVPLCLADGHLFTYMVQGLMKFDVRKPEETSSYKRSLVEFPVTCDESQAIKFVGHYYSEKELAARVTSNRKTPWVKCTKPDGNELVGVLLATNYVYNGERRYLVLTTEKIPPINKDREVLMTFMAGFDPPDIAFDHDAPTSFLMFIYPSEIEDADLLNIDLK